MTQTNHDRPLVILVELPAPRQEECFGGILRLVRVWVGPHSAWKLKPCSSSHKGMPCRSILKVTAVLAVAKFSVVGVEKNFGAPNYFEKIGAPNFCLVKIVKKKMGVFHFRNGFRNIPLVKNEK